jgi:hypothetical protein
MKENGEISERAKIPNRYKDISHFLDQFVNPKVA